MKRNILTIITVAFIAASLTAKPLLYYFKSDNPYDYTAVLVDRGYGQSGTNPIAFIEGLKMNNRLADYYFQYTISDDYISVEFYSEPGTAVDILAGIGNTILSDNAKDYINELSDYDRAHILRSYPSGIRHKNDGFRISTVIVSSSGSEGDIRKITDNYITGSKQKENRNADMKGSITMGNDDIIFSGTGMQDYDLPLYMLLREYTGASIQWDGTDAVLIMKDIPNSVNEGIFMKSKQRLLQRIRDSYNSAYALAKYFPQFAHEGRVQLLKGIEERLKETEFNDFRVFADNIAIDFTIKGNKNPEMRYEPREMYAGSIRMVYNASSDIGTEITILIKNVIGLEQYFGKPFASLLALKTVLINSPGWRMWNTGKLSDICLLTIRCDSTDIEPMLNQLFSAVGNQKMPVQRNTADIDSAYEAIMRTVPQNPPVSYDVWRLSADYDALKMTDGEYRMLQKKLFSSDNILISISSALPPQYFIDILSEQDVPDSDIPDEMNYNSPVDKAGYAFINNDPDRLSMLVKSFFLLPEYFIIDRDSYMMPLKLMENNADIARTLMPSAYMNKNAMSIMNALSLYLFGNPAVIANTVR